MAEQIKNCTCGKPTPQQGSVIAGFQGKLICKNCKGIFTWPLPQEEYKGTDQIEKFLFDNERSQPGMTGEKALLTMLLRIEKQLIKLTPVQPDYKKR